METVFQMLADTINLPCRVAKGCKYCKRDDASSCLVRFGLERCDFSWMSFLQEFFAMIS